MLTQNHEDHTLGVNVCDCNDVVTVDEVEVAVHSTNDTLGGKSVEYAVRAFSKSLSLMTLRDMTCRVKDSRTVRDPRQRHGS